MFAMSHRRNFHFFRRVPPSRRPPTNLVIQFSKITEIFDKTRKQPLKKVESLGVDRGPHKGGGKINIFANILRAIAYGFWDFEQIADHRLFLNFFRAEKRVLFAPFAPFLAPDFILDFFPILISKMTYRPNAKFSSRTHSFGSTLEVVR